MVRQFNDYTKYMVGAKVGGQVLIFRFMFPPKYLISACLNMLLTGIKLAFWDFSSLCARIIVNAVIVWLKNC